MNRNIATMVNRGIINTVKQFVMLIPKEIGIKKAYLFGSFARGKEREESDIDIAVINENMPDFFETQRLLMCLRRKVDLRIEPHYNGKGFQFLKSICL